MHVTVEEHKGVQCLVLKAEGAAEELQLGGVVDYLFKIKAPCSIYPSTHYVVGGVRLELKLEKEVPSTLDEGYLSTAIQHFQHLANIVREYHNPSILGRELLGKIREESPWMFPKS